MEERERDADIKLHDNRDKQRDEKKRETHTNLRNGIPSHLLVVV